MAPEQASSQPSADQKRIPSKKRKGHRRPVPQRTCVGCRTVNPKREMVRVVRTSENTVEVDPRGKRAGRGAYLCQQKSCWERAFKRHSLERALKTTLDECSKAALAAYMQTLPEDVAALPPVSGEESQ